MIKPDVIVTWPTNCDYPHWRRMIRDNRDMFGEVNIVWHETPFKYDFRNFIESSMVVKLGQNANFIHYPSDGESDWRDLATNAGLGWSEGEWIWFTEQDFFPSWDWFQMLRNGLPDQVEGLALMDGTRFHPCCLLIKRSLLERTSKDFAANPPAYDHFGKIQEELMAIAKDEHNMIVCNIDSIYGYHMAGYSHNFRLLCDGVKPNHDIEEFMDALKQSLTLSVPIDSRYIEIVRGGIEKYCK